MADKLIPKKTLDLFKTQKQKGNFGEECFYTMAKLAFEEVYDYRDYDKYKNIQKKGIDFGIKTNFANYELFVDVKTNLYFSTYNNLNQWVFNLCLKKYVGTSKEKDGWFYTSKAHRIYHWNKDDKFSYLYYNLKDMRNLVYREWDKPDEVNWIKKLAYVGGVKSDNALLLPISVQDERFKRYIRKCHIKDNLYTNRDLRVNDDLKRKPKKDIPKRGKINE